MSFTPQFLDELRNRVQVSDIVGRRVKLQKRGREHSGLCPFHNEKSPSFTVNDDKGFYHCFGCGVHGDVIRFVTETEGLNFPEAVEKLAGMAGLDVPKSTPQERERAERAKSLHDANEVAAVWYEKQLRMPQGREALEYLRGRGLSEDMITTFRLGFAPESREGLKSFLMQEGYEEAMLLEAGLLARPEDGRASYDRFRARVIFPITDRRSRVIAFGGRALGDGKPKYLNTADTPLFHKGRTLYALDRAREAVRSDAEVIVTEGYMDVIALFQAGFKGAVAPLGTALTESQIEELWRIAPEPVLCFDGDEAGRRAAEKVVDRVLPLLQAGQSLRFALITGGEDPDSLIRSEGRGAMQRLIDGARPLVEFLWSMETSNKPSDTPERRMAIRKNLKERVATIADRAVQAAYWDDLDARFAAAYRKSRRGDYGRGDYGRGNYGGRQGKGDWRQGGRGGPQRFEDDRLRSDGSTNILATRGFQALLATAVNHPDILDEISERLGEVEFPEGLGLNRLRTALLNAAATEDLSSLKQVLADAGHSAELTAILSRSVYELAPFAESTASDIDALKGWIHLYRSLSRRRELVADKDAARRALATEPTEQNWAYLSAVNAVEWAQEEDEGGTQE